MMFITIVFILAFVFYCYIPWKNDKEAREAIESCDQLLESLNENMVALEALSAEISIQDRVADMREI